MRMAVVICSGLAILLCGCGELPPTGYHSDAAKLAAAAPAAAPAPAKSSLKIIYTAEVRLVVDDVPALEAQLTQLVESVGGYTASASVAGEEERYREGRWELRVPVERYPSFLADVKKLGQVRHLATKADDVTEAYVDLEARLRNKRQEEERLLKLLMEATGKLEEILAVEKELSRVREEIERMDGQFRSLSNKIAMTTITITAGERPEDVPVEKMTFANRLRSAFDYNVELVMGFVKRCVVFVVASVPWWPLMLVAAGLVWGLMRWGKRSGWIEKARGMRDKPNG